MSLPSSGHQRHHSTGHVTKTFRRTGKHVLVLTKNLHLMLMCIEL